MEALEIPQTIQRKTDLENLRNLIIESNIDQLNACDRLFDLRHKIVNMIIEASETKELLEIYDLLCILNKKYMIDTSCEKLYVESQLKSILSERISKKNLNSSKRLISDIENLNYCQKNFDFDLKATKIALINKCFLYIEANSSISVDLLDLADRLFEILSPND